MIDYKKLYTQACILGATLYVKPLNIILKHVVKINGLEGYKVGDKTRKAIDNLIDVKHPTPYEEDFNFDKIIDLLEQTKDIEPSTHKERHKHFMSKVFKSFKD